MKRRKFVKTVSLLGLGTMVPWKARLQNAYTKFIWVNSMDPSSIPKFEAPLVKPPVMPGNLGQDLDSYEISIKQFQQQILPTSMALPTTIWGYGSVNHPGTVGEGGTYNYPSFTIEATHNKKIEVKWINDLKDSSGNYLSHILSVDQTLHWANPPGGLEGRDKKGSDPEPYIGPVPMVTHVHGAHTTEESDGYAEAWYLPAANDIPQDFAETGTFYDYFKDKYSLNWLRGSAVFNYPNDQRATTLWYHDHSVGMTRLNVYAGPAGFYLIRGGADDQILGTLPGPAPGVGDDPFGTYFEIPIVIQDRSFKPDGSLFYPDNRAFFEELEKEQLNIPFIPESASAGLSDVSPIWNPEFFGNTMVVNGNTWPYLEVEKRRYRFRFLNGCNSRFLILKFENDLPFYQIGSEGGFLPNPVQLSQLLMSPAERADVIVDFTDVAEGTNLILKNLAPDEPFGGGEAGVDYEMADPNTTGQVMQFKIIAATAVDNSTAPMELVLPAINDLGAADTTRKVSLNEEESLTVFIKENPDESIEYDPQSTEPFGPTAAFLGTVSPGGIGEVLTFSDPITENPGVGDTEEWEIHNFTADAHPIHVHQVMFKVIGRGADGLQAPEDWEKGWKDTVIAYPEEITRIKAKFDIPGFYVWHCHIVEHEDNEMMRPFHVGPIPSVGIKNNDGATNGYGLGQNYPNPFRETTQIEFQIPKKGKVEVKVYDLRGREVYILVNQILHAGNHYIVWDGRDNNGTKLTDGIYVYTLKAGKILESRTLNIMR